jgi:hypothetical protein
MFVAYRRWPPLLERRRQGARFEPASQPAASAAAQKGAYLARVLQEHAADMQTPQEKKHGCGNLGERAGEDRAGVTWIET